MKWVDWLLVTSLVGLGMVAFREWRRHEAAQGDRSSEDTVGGRVDRPRRFHRAGDPPAAACGDVVRDRTGSDR